MSVNHNGRHKAPSYFKISGSAPILEKFKRSETAYKAGKDKIHKRVLCEVDEEYYYESTKITCISKNKILKYKNVPLAGHLQEI